MYFVFFTTATCIRQVNYQTAKVCISRLDDQTGIISFSG